MSVVNFPAKPVQRPETPEWTEEVHFTPFILCGVDKVEGENLYIVWQEVLNVTDCVVCPTQDVAAALLSHLFNEIFYSNALDNVGPNIFNPEYSQWKMRRILKRLKPFASILEESEFRHIDTLMDFRKHAAAMDVYTERCRIEDEAFKRQLAELEAAGRVDLDEMPEGTPV